MNQDGAPSPGPTAPIVLPRPNLGPEPWTTPAPPRSRGELALGSGLILLALALAIRAWWRRRRQRLESHGRDESSLDLAAPLTPSTRLIASSAAVRAALIAEFGPGWGSRTTQEIAADPTLAERLSPETAGAVVAYLGQVDRAKFAGEEVDQVDEWIAVAESFLRGRPRPAASPRRAP